jgi:hypothetical protein
MKTGSRKLAIILSMIILFSLFFSSFGSFTVQASNLKWTSQIIASPKPDAAGRSWIGDFSLVMDSNGVPHIAYCSAVYFTRSLEYLSWNGVGWSEKEIDGPLIVSGQDIFSGICLALDSNGAPFVVYELGEYHFEPGFGQKVIYRNLLQGSEVTIDSAADPSLVFDSQGGAHLSFDITNNAGIGYINLGVSPKPQTVENQGAQSSLALDLSNNPHISYSLNGILRYAFWNGSAWDHETIAHGTTSSLKIDSKGNAQISFIDGYFLKYALFNGSQWDIQTVDNATNSQTYNCLVLDSVGNPHLCYLAAEGLKYAENVGGNWNIMTVDTQGLRGSLVLDSNDAPHIAYTDKNGDLRYAGIVEDTSTPNPTLTISTTNPTNPVNPNFAGTYIFVAIAVIIVVLAVLLWLKKIRH